MELDITAISISIIAVIGIVFASKTILNHQNQGSKYTKSKIKEQDEYVLFLRKQIQVYKNKASNMQKPPQIDGNIEELDGILPELVGQFSQYAPKWMQPFLQDENAQKWILDYVTKNPETAKKWFGKMIGKKIGNKQEPTAEEILGV